MIAWVPVQGARRATELDARLDTSLGAILDSMLDAGHTVIFDAISWAYMGTVRGVKMPLKKPAYSRDQSGPCSPKWTDIGALRAIGDLIVVLRTALVINIDAR